MIGFVSGLALGLGMKSDTTDCVAVRCGDGEVVVCEDGEVVRCENGEVVWCGDGEVVWSGDGDVEWCGDKPEDKTLTWEWDRAVE